MKLIVLACLMVVMTGCSSLGQKEAPVPVGWVPSCGPIAKTGATYCFYRTGENPKFTLWYVPGLLESSQVLTKSYFDEQGFRDLITSLGPIDVVVIGYGSGYYIRPPGTAGDPQFKEITDTVIPFIETTFKPAALYKALGMSEGGANLVTLITLKPKLFERAVIVHPAILEESTDPYKISLCKACVLAWSNFTQSEWKVANPFYLMRKAKSLPRSTLIACKNDNFDLYPGARDLANLAKLMGLGMDFKDDVDGCNHFGWNNPMVHDALVAL